MKALKVNCFIVLIFGLLLASCSSRKYTVNPSEKAAKAADAMAALKSKDLYRFITDWTGVKYRLGGLDKSGIDCSGFALLLEKNIYGHTLPRRSKDQAESVKKKNKSNLEEGDLIFFSFGGNEVDHVGVYLNNNFFVHASTTRGVVVDDLNMPVYQNAIVKTGTLK
ncbi:C40 family peptidase [Pedobacter boryungensis]|uniref:C40 family peptidase n=1 Tax=Pedobacter boryungensis TaxID=869962 RepID=A0ABX2DAR3_9SPHI|nr:NlpC/P60 family protein [Pedobacter boryungensis]NQX30922.1 C40 family peptidase [Pedobacter boryungensis]